VSRARPFRAARLWLSGRVSNVLILFIALLITAVSLWLLWRLKHPDPVAAAFTRVGGVTRVETSVNASRFWISGGHSIVAIRSNVTPEVRGRATACAMRNDVPLLFTRREGTPTTPTKTWGGGCLKNGSAANLDGLTLFDSTNRGSKRRRFLGVPFSTKLASMVVFAVAKTPRDRPDVAIGLALAAHIATKERKVSLVIVPRYLQANAPLEQQLRNQHERVVDGIVLGETGVLSEDTHALLRQILTTTDNTTVLGELKNTFGSLKDLIPAVLALLGVAATVGVAPAAAREVVRNVVVHGERARRENMEAQDLPPRTGGASGTADAVAFRGDAPKPDAELIGWVSRRLLAEIVAVLSDGVLPAQAKLTDRVETSKASATGGPGPPPTAQRTEELERVHREVQRLFRDAQAARDHTVRDALYKVEYSLQLRMRWPHDDEALKTLWEALAELEKATRRFQGS
jgi:hypothetical protein